MATTQVELVTPERILYSGEAEMIVCRTTGGEIAFLANHMPYIGALEPGAVRVVGPVATAEGSSSSAGGSATGPGGPEVRIAVHGGFVEVRDNRVILLADVAEMANEIDVDRARHALSEAEGRAAGGDADAEAALRRAQVRLEVAGRA